MWISDQARNSVNTEVFGSADLGPWFEYVNTINLSFSYLLYEPFNVQILSYWAGV